MTLADLGLASFCAVAFIDPVIGEMTCPLLVVHGESDRQVPVAQARRTYDMATSSPRRDLLIFPTGAWSETCGSLLRTRARGCGEQSDTWASPGSHSLHRDVIRVSSECVKIVWIRSHHGSARLCESHHDCIDGGASAGFPAQERGLPREHLGEHLHDIAGLEKAVRECVTTGMALQALHKDD